jgi:hypothetical protein
VRTIERCDAAGALAPGWDEAAGSWFRQREFLAYAERYNPCRQRYYQLRDGERVLAGAIAYSLRLDLLTFLRVPSPVTMHLLAVPVGIATPGYFGARADRDELLRHVAGAEGGLLVVLTADRGDDLPIGVRCRMIPTVFLDLRFPDWPAYVNAMRAPHRRRLRRLLARGAQLEATTTGCDAFTGEHHALYRQVHARAEAKLETLTHEFFRHLPARFSLTSYRRGGRLVSWTITVADGDLFMYFFGGMDYGVLAETQAYLVGLAGIVRQGIARRAPRLDLGQTADEPKLRFGGRLVAKEMYLCHRRGWVQGLLRRLRPALEFRGRAPRFHVFRGEGGAP